MRRPARSPRIASIRSCPRGQVGRPLLAGLLAVSLAAPTRAAQAPPAPTATTTETTEEAPTAPPVSAQYEAKRLFRAAKAHYTAGNYEEAARGFEASFKVAESAEAAYNAALARDRVGEPLATMMAFRRYLAVARPETDRSYALAVKRVEELRAKLGELQLQIDSSDEVREIRVNGEAVALAEFPRLVAPGRVEVRLIGDEPGQVADIPAEVAPGGTWTIHFTGFAKGAVDVPDPRPTPPIVRPAPKPDPRVQRRSRALARATWSGVGLTAASAITMGVFGGLALQRHDAYVERLCDKRICDGDEDAAAANRAEFQRHVLTTNVMISVTAGLAVITLALGLATLRERRKLRDQVADGRVRVTVGGLQVAF